MPQAIKVGTRVKYRELSGEWTSGKITSVTGPITADIQMPGLSTDNWIEIDYANGTSSAVSPADFQALVQQGHLVIKKGWFG